MTTIFEKGDKVRCTATNGTELGPNEYTVAWTAGDYVHLEGISGGFYANRFNLVARPRNIHSLKLEFGGFLTLELDMTRPLAKEIAIAAIEAAAKNASCASSS